MDNFREILINEFENADISYTQKNADDICILYKEMCEYNKNINITAITDAHSSAKKHFADSLFPIKSNLFKPGSNCLDIGTGAGFPGLPLAIFLKDCNFTLIDSLSKKLAFTDSIIKKLSLTNVETIVTRAEELIRNEPERRESFDIVFSRAVANLTTLSELALPYLKKDGYFIALKSQEAENELKDAKNAIKILGGKTVEIFGNKERNLIIIKKENDTPEKYPRRNGVPEKRPLR